MLSNFRVNLDKSKAGVIYTPAELDDFIKNIGQSKKVAARDPNGKVRTKYLEHICAFDIEASSWRDDDDHPRACMYAWAVAIDGAVMLGRTWKDWQELRQALHTISTDARMIIYVHNLAYDFGFFGSRVSIQDALFKDRNHPVFVLDECNIEYRCSYLLTNDKLADAVKDLDIDKKTGDLDYNLIRTPETVLTQKEIDYIVHDVLCVSELIADRASREKHVYCIPYTQTGYVRRDCRAACLGTKKDKKYYKYHDKMQSLRLTVDEYKLAERCTWGSHANVSPGWLGVEVHNVFSKDIISSYPAVMVCEKYPMDGYRYNVRNIKSAEHFSAILNKYACMMTIKVTKMNAIIDYDYFLSEDHIYCAKGVELSGRKVVSADECIISMTDVDWDIFRCCYEFKDIQIVELYCYKRAYLPKAYINTVIKYYKEKTELKDSGRDNEYARRKEKLNALSGMMITKPTRPRVSVENGVCCDLESDTSNCITDYNNDDRRFLSYLWGVWVLAYARRNLWCAILNLHEDYIYSDTDSTKYTGDHDDFFDWYNSVIDKKMDLAAMRVGFDINDVRVCTSQGEYKPLGHYETDAQYDRFKAIATKRYITLCGDQIKMTCAGVGKRQGREYLIAKYKNQDAIFKAFDDGLTFPEGHSGRRRSIRCNDPFTQVVTDYTGHDAKVSELTYIYIENSSYSIGDSGTFEMMLEQFASNLV